MKSNFVVAKLPHDSQARDPIDWAIVAVILGGASLLLALEQKIEARQRHESAETEKKAIGGNKLRLKGIRSILQELEYSVSFINDIAKPVDSDKIDGINAKSITFASDIDEEEFNKCFDHITYSISRINRLLNELDDIGWPLSDDDVENFVTTPIREIKESTVQPLDINMDFRERMNQLGGLIGKYKSLVEGLEGVLSAID